jgi:asparagine synthase (glutamine-hydrolysing)
MCGICGYLSSDNSFSLPDLKKMTGLLAHRGPDSEGFYSDHNIGLGHRRLCILDLSENANQPMVSHNGRYVMVFNGEVYNYREIANELKLHFTSNEKIMFRSSSDSEIVLEAFSYYGVSFLEKLNGMFAIAIYDKVEKELYLFRDRIGIKPLYYYKDEKNLAFASELKSIISLPGISKDLSKLAIREYLHLGYIPAPYSIYKYIKKLEPGSYIKYSDKGFEIKKFWDLKSKLTKHTYKDKDQVLVRLSDLLISSVQYQLKSDVPIGVFLSGGIDSSLVTANAVELSSVKVNTFSIGFEENKINESEYARSIAKFLGTNHFEFIVSFKDAINLIDRMFEAYDEPFSDSSAIPTMLVSKLAKESVTVTLTGEGGDELFFGYGFYTWADRLKNPFLRIFRKQIAAVLSRMSNRYKRAAWLFDYENDQLFQSHVFSQEQYLFSESELEKHLTPDYNLPSVLSWPDEFNIVGDLSSSDPKRILNVMESQALFDLSYYLPDDLLTKVDRASMQYGVESRVPYLDHRVVEFALNLSPELKHRQGITKYILKEILYKHIPQKYFARPKQGFAIPLNHWLRHELRYLIEDYLSEEKVNKYGVINYEYVDKLKKSFLSGTDYLYNRIWLLIILHKWFDEYSNQ